MTNTIANTCPVEQTRKKTKAQKPRYKKSRKNTPANTQSVNVKVVEFTVTSNLSEERELKEESIRQKQARVEELKLKLKQMEASREAKVKGWILDRQRVAMAQYHDLLSRTERMKTWIEQNEPLIGAFSPSSSQHSGSSYAESSASDSGSSPSHSPKSESSSLPGSSSPRSTTSSLSSHSSDVKRSSHMTVKANALRGQLTAYKEEIKRKEKEIADVEAERWHLEDVRDALLDGQSWEEFVNAARWHQWRAMDGEQGAHRSESA